MKRAKRERETPEYAQMVRRIIAAHGRRVGDADPEDLAELVAMRATLEEAIAAAVRGQRSNGFSWAAIGRGLGVTRQAAQMAWGERQPQPPNLPDPRYESDLTTFAATG